MFGLLGRQRCHFVYCFQFAQQVRYSSLFYAVRVGRKPGIYTTWDECKEQVEKFPRAHYKKFTTENDALTFLNGEQVEMSKYSTKKNRRIRNIPEVFTDGACIKAGSRGGIGVFWGPDSPWNVSERLVGRQTNNKAEIQAVIRAVQQAKEQGIPELTIMTDSQFVINSMTKWLPLWVENGWKTSSGKPVINREYIEELSELSHGIKIHWNHVRGHLGVKGNEEADKLATEGANKTCDTNDGTKRSEEEDKG